MLLSSTWNNMVFTFSLQFWGFHVLIIKYKESLGVIFFLLHSEEFQRVQNALFCWAPSPIPHPHPLKYTFQSMERIMLLVKNLYLFHFVNSNISLWTLLPLNLNFVHFWKWWKHIRSPRVTRKNSSYLFWICVVLWSGCILAYGMGVSTKWFAGHIARKTFQLPEWNIQFYGEVSGLYQGCLTGRVALLFKQI